MDWQKYLNTNGWKDHGLCEVKCGGKRWKWTKREYEIVLLGVKQTLFILKHKGINTGTFKIYELEEKTKDI